MFPALSAPQAGYDVYGVIDASGTWSPLDQQIAVLRLVHAGVVVMNTVNVLTELQYNHLRPTDEVSGHLFGDLVPALYYTGTQLQQHAEARWRKYNFTAARFNLMLRPLSLQKSDFTRKVGVMRNDSSWVGIVFGSLTPPEKLAEGAALAEAAWLR
jgi:hypothetical protein